ncbi:hypothetical protein AB4Y96_15665 [Phyllobacterium sp. TAF24]|uniref:hypothetical protein n=1 Tax=Phyllobacterium sp. TAF24 TaxID=3233068 RepID=UPI003F9C23B3
MNSIRKTRRVAMMLSSALLLAMTGSITVPLFEISQAIAASSTKIDAGQLQLNMRRSLSTILVAYKNEPKKGSRVDAMLMKATNEALQALGGLEKGLNSRDPRKMTTATSSLSVAVGRIEAISDSARIANPTVREGVRALSANWAAYGTRYALNEPVKSKPVKASFEQVKELKAQVTKLRSQVNRLQIETRSNTQLAANVRRLSSQLDQVEQDRIDDANYQRTVFLLGSFMGWMDGYRVVTTTYYPAYTRYFVVERVTYEYWQTCWSDYYEPYYTYTDWGYYDDPFTPTVNININIDASTQVVVNNYAEQNVSVMIDESHQTENYFENLPIAETDIDMKQVDYTPSTPAYELEKEAARSSLDSPETITAPIERGSQIEPNDNTADETLTGDSNTRVPSTAEEPVVEPIVPGSEPEEKKSSAQPEPSVSTSEEPIIIDQDEQSPSTKKEQVIEPSDNNDANVQRPDREPAAIDETSHESEDEQPAQ